ncbi:ATP-grasp domain-containing protein [Psittacicella hinzii]|uniref:ATP-grasp domain-containing protein n=1 Tax=Psittacicella hinzii TaxID=2028575 RepID=A0A3A1YRI5_9GAMM|nr:hypothetical protein [Psittacicella hinzii]RIY39869.1 hypothetical protein CKF58_01500 [Psittacicella hinzii]
MTKHYRIINLIKREKIYTNQALEQVISAFNQAQSYVYVDFAHYDLDNFALFMQDNELVVTYYTGHKKRQSYIYPEDYYAKAQAQQAFTEKATSIEYLDPQNVDLVLTRFGPQFNHNGFAIVQALEYLGFTVTNGIQGLRNCRDKWLSYLQVADLVPLVNSSFCTWQQYANLPDDFLAYPRITKPNSASMGGNHLNLAYNRQQLAHQSLQLQQFDFALSQDYIQSYDTRNYDLRVMVLNGEVTGAFLRVSQEDKIVANIAQGGYGVPYQITPTLRAQAIAIAQHLGLDICGLDFIFNQDLQQWQFLEANACPGFYAYDKVLGKNFAQDILDYLLLRLTGQTSAYFLNALQPLEQADIEALQPLTREQALAWQQDFAAQELAKQQALVAQSIKQAAQEQLMQELAAQGIKNVAELVAQTSLMAELTPEQIASISTNAVNDITSNAATSNATTSKKATTKLTTQDAVNNLSNFYSDSDKSSNTSSNISNNASNNADNLTSDAQTCAIAQANYQALTHNIASTERAQALVTQKQEQAAHIPEVDLDSQSSVLAAANQAEQSAQAAQEVTQATKTLAAVAKVHSLAAELASQAADAGISIQDTNPVTMQQGEEKKAAKQLAKFNQAVREEQELPDLSMPAFVISQNDYLQTEVISGVQSNIGQVNTDQNTTVNSLDTVDSTAHSSNPASSVSYTKDSSSIDDNYVTNKANASQVASTSSAPSTTDEFSVTNASNTSYKVGITNKAEVTNASNVTDEASITNAPSVINEARGDIGSTVDHDTVNSTNNSVPQITANPDEYIFAPDPERLAKKVAQAQAEITKAQLAKYQGQYVAEHTPHSFVAFDEESHVSNVDLSAADEQALASELMTSDALVTPQIDLPISIQEETSVNSTTDISEPVVSVENTAENTAGNTIGNSAENTIGTKAGSTVDPTVSSSIVTFVTTEKSVKTEPLASRLLATTAVNQTNSRSANSRSTVPSSDYSNSPSMNNWQPISTWEPDDYQSLSCPAAVPIFVNPQLQSGATINPLKQTATQPTDFDSFNYEAYFAQYSHSDKLNPHTYQAQRKISRLGRHSAQHNHLSVPSAVRPTASSAGQSSAVLSSAMQSSTVNPTVQSSTHPTVVAETQSNNPQDNSTLTHSQNFEATNYKPALSNTTLAAIFPASEFARATTKETKVALSPYNNFPLATDNPLNLVKITEKQLRLSQHKQKLKSKS